MSFANLISGAWLYATLPKLEEAESKRRVSICAECPNCSVYNEKTIGALVAWLHGVPRAMWCGVPGSPDSERKTCGCCVGVEAPPSEPSHVTLSYKGEKIPMVAALKTERESPCPSGFF